SYARTVLLCAAAVVIVAAALFVPRRRTTAETAPYAAITPSAGAKWQRHVRGGLDQIELTDGTLSFVVHRSASDPRIFVRVPDGEVEDLGTEFRVVVRQGHTQEISVRSGVVVFRRNNHGSELVTGGSVWTPAPGNAE